ncbi:MULTISPECIES: hypothetical protein [unclassified Sulfitobacter]|uniref:hypothetical protein n=1 Tax=unclassified Sulfitobacter TaxID=196795 RepID=UPI0004E3841F|nr:MULTISPECIES: hypothetical protein [unclassified Sulfitobacter]PTA97695.1 hypothetical protein C8254_16270 [Sulfitobacter sp. CB-A]ULO22221.1 hypothetical protein IV89_003600 [Sulfitobacter sp. CB2047]
MKDTIPNQTTVSITRLRREAAKLSQSIILTPVDNFPDFSDFKDVVGKFHGLYASDKIRSEPDQKSAVIQFGGRSGLTTELNRAHAALADAFNCPHASLRLLSGLHAHIVLFMGLAPIGGKVALLPVEAGGHFATPGILKRLGLNVVTLPVDRGNKCLDMPASLDLIARERPDILFVDRSEGLRYEDFSVLGQTDVPIRIFDSSQYVPQIIAGLYQNPFDWGFNLQVLTLHKSFPGPQKAALVCNDDALWKDVLAGLSAFVSSSHIENSLLVGLILNDRSKLENYAQRLLSTKESLEGALQRNGVNVVPSASVGASDWPLTQHIWIQHDDQEGAFSAWKALEQNRIQTNYRKLPYALGWGQRLGVTAAVSCGLMPHDCDTLGSLIAEALGNPKARSVRHQVTALAKKIVPQAVFGVRND